MTWMIGMDEAGYGPNLGPLVVAATVWRIGVGDPASRVGEETIKVRTGEPGGGRRGAEAGIAFADPAQDPATWVELYELLRDAVSVDAANGRIAIADSKRLYQPGSGLRRLELGVHAACLASVSRRCGSATSTGQRPGQHFGQRPGLSSWGRLVEFLESDPDGRCAELPWHNGFDCRLPIDAIADDVTECGMRLHACCHAADAGVHGIRARLVFPAEFNSLVAHFGSKGLALSHITLSLLRSVVIEAQASPPDPRILTPDPFLIVCDKHGGRNRYAALLQHHFPEHWIETLSESRAASRYRCGPGSSSYIGSHAADLDARGSSLSFTFRTGGEAFLPTALASMTAKYLRELAMRAFNQFWCQRVPKLRPTAGYPVDARRFKTDIEHTQRKLGIPDDILWRNR